MTPAVIALSAMLNAGSCHILMKSTTPPNSILSIRLPVIPPRISDADVSGSVFLGSFL